MIFNKDEYKSRHTWNAIAETKIRDFHLSQPGGIIFPVECEINIDSHCQSPVRISGHKPEEGLLDYWKIRYML